jgi:hypothetical protein
MEVRDDFGARLVPFQGKLNDTSDTLAVIHRHLPKTAAPVTMGPLNETLAVPPAPTRHSPVAVRSVA